MPRLPNYVLDISSEIEENFKNDPAPDVQVNLTFITSQDSEPDDNEVIGSPLNPPLKKILSFTGIRNGPVTVAFAHFTYDAALQIPRFVDRAHTVAKETKASIHCFLGDTLRVTSVRLRLPRPVEPSLA